MLILNQPYFDDSFTRADMLRDFGWSMWKIRQWPFLEIEDGDEVAYMCGGTPVSSRLMWVVSVTYLVKAPYSSHEEAWELLKTGIPASIRNSGWWAVTRPGFLSQEYTVSKSPEGWLLAFSGEPVRWLNRPRPDGFRFRPNGYGWLPDDSPALKPRKSKSA